MKILIACEFSGIVRDEFLKKGHNAYSCDILSCESEYYTKSDRHYKCDVMDILDDNWDMMIAHPPCTYLSNAGARHLYPNKKLNMDRYKKGLEGKRFFMNLYNAKIPRICVENPISSKVFEMPPHSQQIQPYEYGHPYSKATRLWLKNLPLLQPTDIVEKKGTYIHSGASRYKHTNKNKGRWFAMTSKDRSKFWTGIAKAMADQWGGEN